MCKRHRRLGVVLGIVLLGTVLVLLFREAPEPDDQGRRLSGWCIQLSQSSSAEERAAAATAIRPAVPLLVRCLADSDTLVASMAANSLAGLHMEPDLVVPALAAALQHPVPDVRVWSVEGLRAFGPDAQPAVPVLIQALNDPDPGLRLATTNALLRLDPQSLDPLGESREPTTPATTP